MANVHKKLPGLLGYDPSSDPIAPQRGLLGTIGSAAKGIVELPFDLVNAYASALANVPEGFRQKAALHQAQVQQLQEQGVQQRAADALAGSLFTPKPQLQVNYQGMPSDPLLSTQSATNGQMVTPDATEQQTRDRLAYMNNPAEWAKANAQNDEAYTLQPSEIRGVRGQTVQGASKFETIGDQFGAFDPVAGKFILQGSRAPTIAENETGRHNVSTETETGRHNVKTEGLTAAQQAEMARHNHADEGAAFGNLGVAQGNLGMRQQEFNYTRGQDKPLPIGVQRLEDQDLDAINGASAINSHLGQFVDQIDSGQLHLGPVANGISKLKNLAGMSDVHSQAYADFRANLEKQRNDSLRLNKGVQTEGDAQRAWNELFSNMNDPAVVKNRLKQIQTYNDQAIDFHAKAINQRRTNNHASPLNVDQFRVAPTAPAAPAAAGGWKITGVQ